MSSGRKAWLVYGTLMGGLLAAFAAVQLWGERKPEVAAETPGVLQLPAVSLPGIGGDAVDLGRWHGRPVLLNFWASWCSVCREEHKALQTLAAAFPGALVGVATADQLPAVQAAEREQPSGYPIAFDQDGHLAKSFGVEALPQTFIFSADGHLLRHIQGPLSRNDQAAAAFLLGAKR